MKLRFFFFFGISKTRKKCFQIPLLSSIPFSSFSFFQKNIKFIQLVNTPLITKNAYQKNKNNNVEFAYELSERNHER